MTEQEITIPIRLSEYPKPGLYLTLEDSTRLVLTRENIEKVTMEYWKGSHKFPPRVKKSVEFQRCGFCPLKKKGDFCDALRPVLPLLDFVDKFVSHDRVTVAYKPEDKGLVHISYTTMQNALRYISILSLTRYCQIGRKYWKYSMGIIPVLRAGEIANRMYLNMYWLHKGDKEIIDKTISKYYEEITNSTRNQLARLRLICKNDAFLNAFVNAHLIADLLYMHEDDNLKKSFDEFEKELIHT